MAKTIKQLVEGLAGQDAVGDVCRLLDEHLERGDTAYLAEFGAALHTRYGSGRAGAEHQYLFDRILWDVVTTPGPENVGYALWLGLATRSRSGRPVRRAAAVLAAHQPLAALAGVFAGDRASETAPEELRACLVHELVLRGAPIAERPEVVAWAAASPYWAGHPLAWLPWTLAPLEGVPSLPHYSRGGAAYGVGYGLPEGERLTGGGAAPVVRRGAEEPGLGAAVERWAGRFNGRVETAVFHAAEPVGPEAVPAVLAALSLDCLAGSDPLMVVPGTAAQAWRQLFGAASIGGGREDEWWYGAYGRLAAWRSLAALAGAAEDASPEEVQRRAEGCAWYCFAAATDDWFNLDTMDLGLAVLDTDRRRLAVLAATDYDGG
ncbi:hypothetical protein F7Q99_29000 [Streptomyces kaniharaensis]|uniref:Uncharacterized protein n=1 Tax=Streptomyces kaniharaensis TaxID=212423 RepID=A0A6N7KZZ6_9ACTN|nr:DUF6183 family protein [Streptomyces kaniharaensis]MQS16159.1 hypothetical protein [Streptomyces kaniharaensis]